MRWERLFDDLEAQLEAESARELEAEVADRTRRERALLGLHGRLVAAAESRRSLDLRVAGVGTVAGAVERVGSDWVLVLTADGRTEVLVPLPAVRMVTGLAGVGGARESVGLASSLGLGSALRAISRDRSTVEVVDVDGQGRSGTIDAVGADLLDVAEHPVDLPRRREHVVAVHTMPFTALAAVRRRT